QASSPCRVASGRAQTSVLGRHRIPRSKSLRRGALYCVQHPAVITFRESARSLVSGASGRSPILRASLGPRSPVVVVVTLLERFAVKQTSRGLGITAVVGDHQPIVEHRSSPTPMTSPTGAPRYACG